MTIADLLSDPRYVGTCYVDEREVAAQRGTGHFARLMDSAQRQALNDLLRKLGIEVQTTVTDDRENRRRVVHCRFVRKSESIDLATDFVAID